MILVLRIPPQDLGQSRFLMDGELDTGGKARTGTEYQYLSQVTRQALLMNPCQSRSSLE